MLDSSGKSEKNLIERQLASYDTNGYLNTVEIILPDSNRCKNEYSYNEKHKLIEEKLFNTHNSLPEIITYQYNNKGNDTLESKTYQSSDFGSNVVSSYDADNRLLEQRYIPVGTFKDSNYIQPYTSRIRYDGKTVEVSSFSANNTSKGKCIYKYDNDGNLIELTRYDEKGNLTDKNTYSTQGNTNTSVTFGPDGHIVSKRSDKDDNFDKNGNPLKIMTFDSVGKMNLLIEREIEYYP